MSFIYDWLLEKYCRMEVDMFMEAQIYGRDLENVRFYKKELKKNK